MKLIESVEQRFKMGSEHVYGDFTSRLETAVELVIKTIQDPSAAKPSRCTPFMSSEKLVIRLLRFVLMFYVTAHKSLLAV
ncbi:hypothetical protein AC629_02410 [Bradyrhizobium sp. NAS80.1]|nr:hypothetical protein AC629_02410 [Bradyrhizobium sp. NAS80.1]